MTLGTSGFTVLDWSVLFAYCAVVLVIGYFAGRKKPTGNEFFLAGRSMPIWAVAISLLATMQSAATFIGGPEEAFKGNLSYLSTNLGSLLAAILVAAVFLPVFYRRDVTSIYELLGQEFGLTAHRAASAMFLLGRTFASGARLYIVAIPFSLIVHGDLSNSSMLTSIAVIAAVAGIYTTFGGIRAVIWTDVLQAAVSITAISVALWLLWQKIPVSGGEFIEAVRNSPFADKLTIIDLDFSFPEGLAKPYSFWAVLIGMTLFMTAALGTDQDLIQRLLTCRNARAGGVSLMLSMVIGWPVVFLFLAIGLVLFVYYQQPGLVGMAGAGYEVPGSREVLLTFILNEMPIGLRGLTIAGLFAAAMSSTDSALNAMASSTIADFYRPFRKRRETGFAQGDAQELLASRAAVVFWCLALGAFAGACVYWQRASQSTLIAFALGVMVFAYGGMLGVFLTALFTKRGNSTSVVAALVWGFVAVEWMQAPIWNIWAPRIGLHLTLAFPWQMTIATALSFLICCCGRRPGQ